MLKIPLLTALACTFVLSACETPTDDTAAATTDTTSTDTTTTDDTSAAARGLISGNVALPAQMALVTVSDAARSATRASTSTRDLITTAALDAYADNSDYNTAHQNAYVWLDASEPIDFIDSFLCFTGQTQPLEMMGKGDYLAWVDAGCFAGRDDGGQTKGAKNPAPSYVPTIVNTSMAVADGSPLMINGWVPEFPNEGQKFAVKLLGEVTEIPSQKNPFGIFRLTYGLLPSMESDVANSYGFGEVVSSMTDDGSSSFTLYQDDKDEEMSCITLASVNYNQESQEGTARTANTCVETGTTTVINGHSDAYAMRMNADFVHMSYAHTLAELDAATDDNISCLKRDQITDNVFNYSLYKASDGSDVVVNSSMQLRVDSDGDTTNGYEKSGQIGYWGSWREDGLAWKTDDKVQEATRGDTPGGKYKVKVAPGRLVKNTAEKLDFSMLGGVEFQTTLSEDAYFLNGLIDLDGGLEPISTFDVRLKLNVAGSGLEITKKVTVNDQQESAVVTLGTPIALSVKTGSTIFMWSNQLGGEVMYTGGNTDVTMNVRTFVDGDELKADELFDGNNNPTLNCIERCLKAGVTATDIGADADWADVFVSDGDPQATATYTFAQDTLTLVSGSNKIIFDPYDAETEIGVGQDQLNLSNYWAWGLQTGPMVTSDTGITTASAFYDALESDTPPTFYTWETGINSWQQQVVLIDESNLVVTFEKPIRFKYTHDVANDRNDDSSKHGVVFMMEYGGKGNLSGLPWVQEATGKKYWYPEISIKDGTFVGLENQYILKAMNIEQRMTDALASDCDDLSLTDSPSEPLPAGITQKVFELAGTPTLSKDTEASVVSGEVQSAE